MKVFRLLGGDYNYFWIREIARNGILDCLNIPLEEQKYYLILRRKRKRKNFLLYIISCFFYILLPSNLEGGKDLIIGKSRRKGFSYKKRINSCIKFFS